MTVPSYELTFLKLEMAKCWRLRCQNCLIQKASEVVPVPLFAEAAVPVAKEFVELGFPKLDSPLCGLGTRPKLLSVAGDTNPNGFEGLADVALSLGVEN